MEFEDTLHTNEHKLLPFRNILENIEERLEKWLEFNPDEPDFRRSNKQKKDFSSFIVTFSIEDYLQSVQLSKKE